MLKRLWKSVVYLSPRGKTRRRLFFILILALAAGFFVYPQGWNKGIDVMSAGLSKAKLLPAAQHKSLAFLQVSERPFHLGLDLAGGAHLVYEADMSQIAWGERGEAMEGARDVIERRVNAFGVAEPLVQTARAGETWHLVVELAGIKDVKEAIKQIGETPVLEFKEEAIPEPTRELTKQEHEEMEKYNEKTRKRAEEVIEKIKAQEEVDFMALAKEYSEDMATKDVGGSLGFITRDSAYGEFWNIADSQGAGKIILEPMETLEGWNIVRVFEGEDRGKEARARHLLICYRGAESCDKDISKDEALKRVKELKARATPENFEELVKANSTEPGADQAGGYLDWFGPGAMVKPFEDAVSALASNMISEPVKTQFGYHLIHKLEERPQKAYNVARILIRKKTAADYLPSAEPWLLTKLSGKHLKRSSLQFDPNTKLPQVGLEFNSEGKDLFADITTRNVEKLVAIFLDGYPISVPRVQTPITDGQAVITGNFTLQEAKLLAQRLNAGALPVPINLISQQTVGATLGSASINASLKAALIGFLAVAIFMILYYRLAGLLAVLALIIYVAIVLALFKLIPVTLTLAGIAGFILSVGMAVDANVLIFARLQEEIRAGKDLKDAVEDAFKRAWPSIRDGNLTTLFAALIFFWFSTSLVKGFGLTLSVGILVSLFCAMVVTRVFLRVIAPHVKKGWWYGARVRAHKY